MSNTNQNCASNRDLGSDSQIYDEFLDDDYKLAKPEVENIEIAIFLNRLIGIFEILMDKLQFAATLPMILSHPMLFSVLSKTELKQVDSAFGSFSNLKQGSEATTFTTTLEQVSCKNTETMSSCARGCMDCCSYKSNVSSTTSTNTRIYTALEILASYRPIRQLSKMSKKDIAKPTISFLRQMKYFMDFVISKSKLTPEEARENELYYHNICLNIERAKEEISELIVSLEKQKIRHQIEAVELANDVNRAMAMWKNINQEFDDELAKTLKDAENSLAKSVEEHNERMESHRQTVENIKKQTEDLKMHNRKIDNDVLGKKFKVESQLLSIINTFDTEITASQEAYEELMREYEALEAERDALKEDMDEQLEIYNEIMREQEEKEMDAYREKYMKFVTNRCAKIIQRWWRIILEKRRKKKKKGKGKKKKKK